MQVEQSEQSCNQNYYFCYGSEGQDYRGGWTEINAPSLDLARELFRLFHPSNPPGGFLACGEVCTEEQFRERYQNHPQGNLGAFRWEKIVVTQKKSQEKTGDRCQS